MIGSTTLPRICALFAMGWVFGELPRAQAYSDPSQFELPVLAAGGGGRFYTGSPAEGYGCDSCHRGGVAPHVTVSGLPERYVPKATYEIRVAWARSLEHVALALELSDEHGHGAGTLALPAGDDATDDEQCQPSEQNFLAAQLYAADRGRTIVAAPDCGASAVRVQWTAPRNAGPVWLAFGVLTSNQDGDFTGDGTTQFAQPIPPFGESLAPVTITGSCAVARNAATSGNGDRPLVTSGLGAWVVVFGLRTARRRRRRSQPLSRSRRSCGWLARVLLWVSLLSGCSACDAPLSPEPVVVKHGNAVTPWDAAIRLTTVQAGSPATDAGADGASDASTDAGEARDAAGPVDAGPTPVDAGEGQDASLPPIAPLALSFRVTTLSQNGRYAPKNVGAIWIEDSTGRWLRTLKIWASVRERYLTTYAAANKTHNRVDAVTSGTLRMHTTHEVTWDLTDSNRKPIADGDYRVVVEVTDRDETGQSTRLAFTKANTTAVVTAPDSPFFVGIELRWLTTAAGAAGSSH